MVWCLSNICSTFTYGNTENTFITHLFYSNFENELKILWKNKIIVEIKRVSSIMGYKIHEVLKLFSTLSTKADDK
jgi:hypothetical protein